MFVRCVLSGRGLFDESITRPRGVLPTVARDQKTSCDEEAIARAGLQSQRKSIIINNIRRRKKIILIK
jgi:hypothetical protein